MSWGFKIWNSVRITKSSDNGGSDNQGSTLYIYIYIYIYINVSLVHIFTKMLACLFKNGMLAMFWSLTRIAVSILF